MLSAVLVCIQNLANAGEISFRNDVMAVLSKAGCNRGVCHGNLNGKGGFKLSLRGEDPKFDFESLTRDQAGRRANPLDPDRSLLLLKPTMQVPHEGGRRFTDEMPEYRVLRSWIEKGLPADSKNTPRLRRIDVSPAEKVLVDPAADLPISVTATFSDGTTRDITRLAVYETDNALAAVSENGVVQRAGFGETTIIVRYLDKQSPVRVAFVPARPGFAWNAPEPINEIDGLNFAKLRSLRINPSEVTSDTEFFRRAYLDLLGIIPTANEAKRFVADRDPDKRSRLINKLLERQEFADAWAQKWSDLLRVEEKTLDRKGVRNFHGWIRQSIAENKPLDQFAREILSARGSTYTNPPANYYRALRDPITRAETTAQVFLGIRLQCAKCHSHPFDEWTQDDYYGWSAVFAKIDYRILDNRRRDQNDKHEFDGEQLVLVGVKGDVKNPRTQQRAEPRFLGSDSRVDRGDRLQLAAEWVTSPSNERFAQMQANRIWFHLMGVGIVDPIDDFRATNPPSNPELLNWLSHELVASKFDLKHMIRTIMNSRTYQLTAIPNETNREDDRNFSHAPIRRLSAEQLLDSFSQVLNIPANFNGYPPGLRAGEIPGVMAVRSRDKAPASGDHFLKVFGRPSRLQSCECERSEESTLSQAFELVSGPLLHEMLSHRDNRLSKLLAAKTSSQQIVDDLYWSALARAPSESEMKVTVAHLESGNDRRSALEDIAWALLTSDEFVLRR